MVCRENKARSTAIRLAKEMCKAQGLGSLHDRELQSAIHERQHHFDGAPPMTTEQQIAFVEGLCQQIENDPSTSDREKYRQSRLAGLPDGRRDLGEAVDERGRLYVEVVIAELLGDRLATDGSHVPDRTVPEILLSSFGERDFADSGDGRRGPRSAKKVVERFQNPAAVSLRSLQRISEYASREWSSTA